MRLKTSSFRGELPRLTPRALPDDASQDATNARLLTGDVTAWNQFALTKTLSESGPVGTIALMAGQYWLSWDQDVDVARGIIPGDNTYRTYITGLDVPRFTNLAMATTGAEPYPVTTRPLGVPGPESAPTVAAGIDPTPTTYTVDVFDEGDVLATDWTTSPVGSPPLGDSSVVQSSAFGNPIPSYLINYGNNSGVPAYLYRNFGTGGLGVVRVSFDFMFRPPTSGETYRQMITKIAATAQGEGIHVTLNSTGFALAVSQGWNSNGSALVNNVSIGNPATDVWYTCVVDVVANVNSTKSVTATMYLGSVQLATISVENNFVDGDYCGFVGETGNDSDASPFFTFYDNILVQGTGSTGYNPLSTATSYVYTFVNDLGEESAPSFASSTVLRPDGIAITVTMPTAVSSGVSSDYGITTKRIYRAATGTTGTLFLFVAEVPLAQAEYVDSIPDTELGEALESEGWDLPPDDLRGILALPNGVMVGFRRNQLCLSAQNRPHAWPVAYRLNTDTDIVGIGNIDTTVVMGTENFPYLAGGSDPAAYSMSKLEVPQACVAKRSFACLTGIGVVFATPDGLAAVAGTGQVRNLTETIFTREQWQALTPSTIIAAAHDDVYYFFSGSVESSDPDYDDVILLLHFEGADGTATTTDSSSYENTIVFSGSGEVSTDFARYGNSSLHRPAVANSGVSIPSPMYDLARRLGSADFTIEFSMYRDSVNPTPTIALGDGIAPTYTLIAGSGFVTNDRLSAWFLFDGASWGLKLDLGAGSFPIGVWKDICLQRAGNTIYMFVNGVMAVSGAFAGTVDPVFTAPPGISIGGGGAGSNGYVDEIRITRNVARYPISGYTPAGPFPDSAPVPPPVVPGVTANAGYALDMKSSGFGLVPLAYHASALYADPLSDNLYLVLDANEEPTDELLPVASTAPEPDGVTIYQFNGDPESSMVYRWRSKLYVLPRPTTFMRIEVKAASFANTVVRFYKQVLTAGAWADVLVRAVAVTSEDLIPLPAHDDYTRCWWEVISTDPLQSVQLVEDVTELD